MSGDTPTPIPALQRIVLESDGVTVRIAANVPLDVTEALLYRALAQVGRNLLRAQLQQDAAPKIEVVPSLPRNGML